MRMRLTETSVLALRCKAKPYRVQDSGTDSVRGLHVLVQKSGTRTYRCDYKMTGTGPTLAVALGRVEDVSLADARDKAREVKRQAARGIDPRGNDTAETFEEVMVAWGKWKLKQDRVPESTEATEKYLTTACKPWLPRKFASITKTEIVTLLDRKMETAKYSANLCYAHLRSLFRWAKKRGLISSNPTDTVDQPYVVKRAKRGRKRTWFRGAEADAVIRVLWRFAETLCEPERRFIQLLVLTGKRRTCVENISWQHISQDWLWTPPYRSDNKRNNPVPLPSFARELLTPRGDIGRVLLGMRHPNTIDGKIKQVEGIPADWFWHSLRHIAITKMRELKVPREIAKLVTDHADVELADVHSGYDHADLTAECLEALERYADHVRKIVGQ